MSEGTESVKKDSKFAGIKAEFKRISWPDKHDVAKQTATVIAIAVALGVVISLLDFVMQYGVDLLMTL